ncbi:MAG TPA: ABC transporter permease [Pseudonocardiaceae bacterium]|nr:ABC transporter permease [Pseudonocardiaceae bacterium]
MRYVLRKLGFYAVAAWLAITLNFLLPRLIPGDPVEQLIARMSQGGAVAPGEADSLRQLLGLGRGNGLQQYVEYLHQLVTLRFGTSITYFPLPVTKVIGQEIYWTVILVGVALLLSVVVGLALGAVAGWRRGTWLDTSVPTTMLFSAMPYFWVALLLGYVFAQRLHLFPLSGGYDPALIPGWHGAFIATALRHAILPALTIVISSVGTWMFGMRNMMVSTLAEDYVVAAQAKGLRPRTVLWGYAARNAVIPSVSGFAISLGFVVSGALAMEIVFSYPGIGYNLLTAVQNDDFPLMQGIFLVITMAVLAANLLVDLLHGFIDPRTRAST